MIIIDFELIYKENFQKIYLFLMHMCKDHYLSEELAQESLYKAFVNIDSFKGNCKISTWLCQIAKNEYFQYLRQQKRIKKNQNKILSNINLNTLEYIESRDEINKIITIIKSLPLAYQNVFIEKIFMQLNYREIAKLHQKTESWARVTYYRAKLQLKERMQIHEN